MRDVCRCCCRAWCAALVGRSERGRGDGEGPLLSGGLSGLPLVGDSPAPPVSATVVARDTLKASINDGVNELARLGALPPRGVEALERIGRAFEDLRLAVEESERWGRVFPDGGTLLNKVAAQAAGEENPPEWAGGQLCLGSDGLLFEALYEPFVFQAKWCDIVAAERLSFSPGVLQCTNADFTLKHRGGAPEHRVGVLQLSLAREAAEALEEALQRQSGRSNMSTNLGHPAASSSTSFLRLCRSDCSNANGTAVELVPAVPLQGMTTQAETHVAEYFVRGSASSALEVPRVVVHGVDSASRTQSTGSVAVSFRSWGGTASFFDAVNNVAEPFASEEPIRRISLDISQDGVLLSIAMHCAGHHGLAGTDASARAGIEAAARATVASAAGNGTSPEHVVVAIAAGIALVLLPASSDAPAVMSRLNAAAAAASAPDTAAETDPPSSTAASAGMLCVRITAAPLFIRKVAGVYGAFLARDWLVPRCLEEQVGAREIDAVDWAKACRAVGETQVRRLRFRRPLPPDLGDFTACMDSKCLPRIPELVATTVMYRLCGKSDEVTLSWQTFSPDMPYGEHFQSHCALIFKAQPGNVVMTEVFARLDVVMDFPSELVSSGDDEIVQYVTRDAHEREASKLGEALGDYLSCRPLTALPQRLGAPASHLAITVRYLSAAAADVGSSGELRDLARVPFLMAMEAFAVALGRINDKLPSYFLKNTRKLRRSRASTKSWSYRPWILSELPVHVQTTRCRGYADDSAWMANLWLGFTLDFFVEMLALLHEGADTKTSTSTAYRKTLYNNLGFVERQAFSVAIACMPAREDLLQRWEADGAGAEEVTQDVGDLVGFARPIVIYCAKVNKELDQLRQAKARELRGS